MNKQDEPPKEYIITVRNSRTIAMYLTIEPEGWGWLMEPGEVFEIVFESPEDFWTAEPVVVSDDAMTFWGAFPCAVLLVMADGERDELMRHKRS